MYRVKFFSTVLLILCTLSLYGCAETPANRSASNAPATMTSAMPEVNFEPDEKRNIAESDVACLKPGMTLGSIIDLIGSPHADELSVDYPLLYSWKIDEEKNCISNLKQKTTMNSQVCTKMTLSFSRTKNEPTIRTVYQ